MVLRREALAGIGYVMAPASARQSMSGAPEQGVVEFEFDLPHAGNYVIWGRVQAPSGTLLRSCSPASISS